jgi:hypothetical protein
MTFIGSMPGMMAVVVLAEWVYGRVLGMWSRPGGNQRGIACAAVVTIRMPRRSEETAGRAGVLYRV